MPLRQSWGSRMAKLKLSPLAEEDLREIKAYIEQESGESERAAKQLANIISKLRFLQEQPQMGASLTAMIGMMTEYRYLVCGSYYAFYRQIGDTVYIVRILHCARDFMRVLFGTIQEP